MKKMTRLYSALLAAAMFASMALTGCGDKEDTNSSVSKEDSKASSSASETAKTDRYTEVGTYFPIVNEETPLTIFTPQLALTIDYETNEFSVWLEEKTGLTLTFETAPLDAAKEKVNLLFASNTLPDMFMNTDIDDSRYGVEEGQLMDLTELVDTKMPAAQDAFKRFPTMRGALTQTDGKIYMLPAFNECYHCSYATKMWYHTEHLKELGMDVPTTTEELYEVCKKFKELHPNYIPIAGCIDGWFSDPFYFLCDAFTYWTPSAWGLRLQGDTVDTYVADENYREALRYMHRLHKDGLLYDAMYTTTGDQLKSLVVEDGEPVLFFPAGTPTNVITPDSTPELYHHYYAMAPVEGPAGFRAATHMPSNPYGNWALSSTCAYPEAAVRLVDYLLTKDGSNHLANGADNWKYIEESEGWLGANGEPATVYTEHFYQSEPQNEMWQDVTGIFDAEHRFAINAYRSDEEVDLWSSSALEALLYKTTKEEMEPYKNDKYQVLPPINFLLDENTSVQTIKVELEKFIDENKVAFITGTKDIDDDAAWNDYLKALDSIGMPKLIDVYQVAYDRQYK